MQCRDAKLAIFHITRLLVLHHDIASYVPFKAGVDYALAYHIISLVLLLKKTTIPRLIKGLVGFKIGSGSLITPFVGDF